MVIFNKILNVLVFLLAIVACVTAFLLHKRRVELRDRADILSNQLASVIVALDGGDSKSTDFNLQDDVNEETMDWKTFHKEAVRNDDGTVDHSKFIAKIAVAKENADKLVNHDKYLIGQIVDIAKNLKDPAVKEKDAVISIMEKVDVAEDSPNNYKKITEKMKDHATKVEEHRSDLVTGVVNINNAIVGKKDPGLNEVIDNLEREISKPEVDAIIAKATALKSLKDTLAKGYSTVIAPLSELPFPEWSEGETEIDSVGKNIESLSSHMKQVNLQLKEKKKVEQQFAKARKTIETNKVVIEGLNLEVSKLKNTVKERDADILKRDNEIGLLKKRVQVLLKDAPIATMPEGLTAKVLSVNPEWEFVMLNKGEKDKMAIGGYMILHRGNKVVCKVRITRVLKDVSFAEIQKESRLALPKEGDGAIVYMEIKPKGIDVDNLDTADAKENN